MCPGCALRNSAENGDNHPSAPGGRLADLQIASVDELEVLGLIEGPLALEREIQGRFARHRVRDEWFRRHEEILEYFNENGIAP